MNVSSAATSPIAYPPPLSSKPAVSQSARVDADGDHDGDKTSKAASANRLLDKTV